MSKKQFPVSELSFMKVLVRAIAALERTHLDWQAPQIFQTLYMNTPRLDLCQSE